MTAAPHSHAQRVIRVPARSIGNPCVPSHVNRPACLVAGTPPDAPPTGVLRLLANGTQSLQQLDQEPPVTPAVDHAAGPFIPFTPHPPGGITHSACLGDAFDGTRSCTRTRLSARLIAKSVQRAALSASASSPEIGQPAPPRQGTAVVVVGTKQQHRRAGQDGTLAVQPLVVLTFQSRTRKLSRQLQAEVRVWRFKI